MFCRHSLLTWCALSWPERCFLILSPLLKHRWKQKCLKTEEHLLVPTEKTKTRREDLEILSFLIRALSQTKLKPAVIFTIIVSVILYTVSMWIGVFFLDTPKTPPHTHTHQQSWQAHLWKVSSTRCCEGIDYRFENICIPSPCQRSKICVTQTHHRTLQKQ